MKQNLSFRCRSYVLAVGCLGMAPVAWAAWHLAAQPPHPAWLLLAALALLNGPLSIRIPSLRASISVSEGVLFTSALLFGPVVATLVAALDGLAVSLWSRNRSAVQTLFGVAEPAISVCAASLLFYRLTRVPPLLHHAAPLAPLVWPLLALVITYFTLNTLLAGTAVWLDTGKAPIDLLRQHVPNLALDLSVSMSVAAAVVQTSGSPALAGLVVLAPMLIAGYISSHHTAGRLEDTNRHLSELRRLYDSTVETLALAIDAKDQGTHGHIRRVQLLSTRLARALGGSEHDVRALEAAALLHDLGKLAVPEHILNKPGPLTPGEYDQIKQHADIGASILSGIDFPFPVVPIVRHHHENWDGTGYPDGLSGADIPVGARILAVVDCYDALTSDRPYRRRMSHADAVEIIRSRSGRMYDPAVVEAFVRLHTDVELAPAPVRRFRALGGRPAIAANQAAAPIRSAAVKTSPLTQRARIAQFARTLHQNDWQEAGRAVEAFARGALPDSVGALFHLDPNLHRLIIVGVHHGFDSRIPDRIAVGQGVTGWVGANNEAVVNADAELDLGDVARIVHPPLRLCMSVPLAKHGSVEGVLTVYSPYAFSEIDRMVIDELAEALADILCSPAREARSAAL